MKFSGTGLSTLDLAIIVVYLIGITIFGIRFRKADRSLKNYFLADKRIPWWAIALSIVAAETSTLTIISVPGLAYDSNFGFLQLVFGYLAGRVVISLLFIPQYFHGEMYTAYQLIDRRFGPMLHKVTATVFLLTRAAAEGVRVFAISIVVGIAIGTGDITSIAIIMLLTLIYTFEGGLAAVIWTDVIQMIIYIGGTIVGVFTILHLVPGGWPAVHVAAARAGKFTIFDLSWSLSKAYTFWAGMIGGTFLTTASHGTDQLMVQRLLAARSAGESRVALLSSGIAILFQFALFLLVGASLFVFYKILPPAVPFTRSDRIFPTFIVEQMPHGVSGLLIAAILAAAMSNLSAALNSLASTTTIDFYLRLRPQASEKQRIVFSRTGTMVWGMILFVLAILSRGGGHVVEVGLSIASVAYGGLLGVFLLGTLTKRANETGAVIGMLLGLAANLFLWLQPHAITLSVADHSFNLPKVAFTWYVTIGATLTFIVGYIASLMVRTNQHAP